MRGGRTPVLSSGTHLGNDEDSRVQVSAKTVVPEPRGSTR